MICLRTGRKGQQQAEAVAVGHDGARAYVSLLLQPFHNELLYQNGKWLYGGLVHDVPP